MSLILFGKAVAAKNLGVFGHTYEIKEQNALSWIAERLENMRASGELEKQQVAMQRRISAHIQRPPPVKHIKTTTTPRSFALDLTLVLPKDIFDAEGKILFKKGMKINPLKYTKSLKKLLFIDGDDPKQVDWAINMHKSQGDFVKLILVKGAIIDLMEQKQVQFYFDQAGKLTKYFTIEQVPAIVEQKGQKLHISEVRIS